MLYRTTSLSSPPKYYPVRIGDTAQSLACRAPGCPYYLPRMPSRRLALIYIALFGAFSNRLLVLVEECDTWRLMACISDMPAGEWEASFLPSCQALLKLESHPKQQTRISPKIGISVRANHTEGKHKQTLSVGFGVLDTQAKKTCKYLFTHAYRIHTHMIALFSTCVLGDGLAEAEMFMNAHCFVCETGKLVNL